MNVRIVIQCRLDQVKKNENFRLIGSKVIWNAYLVEFTSLFAVSEKRKTTFVFDERYNCKSIFNATKADRQVQILEFL